MPSKILPFFLTLSGAVLLLDPTLAPARAPSEVRIVDESGFSDAIDPIQRDRIEAMLAHNRAQLRAQGALTYESAVAPSVVANLQWPLKPTATFSGFGYHGISNFVDHDPRAPGFVKDYMCGARTYDSADGSNHAGTDYFITPFPWLMMDEEQVAIVAAAPGRIIGKDDGNFDRDCAIDFAKLWNAVYVQHADGSVAWYGHMKAGTPTSKPIGAMVEAGEVLGYVGSSGASSGPHLHFELHDSSGTIVDPRHGDCNESPDLWAVFQPYEDPKINSLSTHSQEPEFAGCGVDATQQTVSDVPHYADAFTPGDTVHVLASYRDQRTGESSHFQIAAPDGSIVDSWDFDLAETGLPRPFYSGTAFTWTYTLAAGAPGGTWHVRATFQGNTYEHDFVVHTPTSTPVIDRDAAGQARSAMSRNAGRCRPNGDPRTSPCKP
ncbi:MAG TPA: peptidoglycan DD-metalloendopeptidase family protein [Rudaea sp.]